MQDIRTDKLRECWRVGDALQASALTGIAYQSVEIPEGLDWDEALMVIVADARSFIDYAYRVRCEPA